MTTVVTTAAAIALLLVARVSKYLDINKAKMPLSLHLISYLACRFDTKKGGAGAAAFSEHSYFTSPYSTQLATMALYKK